MFERLWKNNLVGTEWARVGGDFKKGCEKVEQCGRLDHAVKWKTLGGFWAKELYNMVYKLKNYNDQCVENNYTSLRYRNRTTN